MTSVRVIHDIDDLARDMATIAATTTPRMAGVVGRNAEAGSELARGFAKASSGRHGLNYYKRISAEAIGPLAWEYGPHGQVAGNAVGGGWRNGPPNTDQARSADVIGPQFADEVGDELGDLFW